MDCRCTLNNNKNKEKQGECLYRNGDQVCEFTASKKNGYCGKHQNYHNKIQVEKTVCVDYVRGCKNILDEDDEFQRCEDCRKKKNEYQKIYNKS